MTAATPAGPSPTGAPLDEDVLQNAAATFGILSATARLQIVWLLADGERDVTTLAREVGQSVAAVSQHLAKLRLAGLIRVRRAGRRSICTVEDPHLLDVVRLVVGHHAGADQPGDEYRSRAREA